jgi:3-methyl-2-oxobutanoate hydroxymethyltransferase
LPQSAKNFKFKGKDLNERKIILKDSKLLTKAGAFSIVLECIESSLAKEITKTINIPTIGIGGSVYCDGQVLVTDDLIGLNQINARFVKKYSNITKHINSAIIKYKNDVKRKKFPQKKHSY